MLGSSFIQNTLNTLYKADLCNLGSKFSVMLIIRKYYYVIVIFMSFITLWFSLFFFVEISASYEGCH